MRFFPWSSSVTGITAFAFLASAVSTDDLTTYTFSSVSFGAADGNRKIIIAFGSRAAFSRTVVSATIGGVAASIAVQAGTGNDTTALLVASVPTGATGDVVVTLSAGALRAGIAIYRVVASTLTLDDTDSGTGTTVGMSLDIAAGGIAIATATSRGNSNHSYTGLNEDCEESLESAAAIFSSASDVFGAASTGHAISVSSNGYAAAVVSATWH
jgi:hypothetical protein